MLSSLWGTPLLVLMTVVAILLLIACINVATMLLARSAARQREMAVRVSLGAGRVRLVRQVFIESLLLSSVASALGVWLAYVGASALVRTLASGRLGPGLPAQLIVDVHPDGRVLMFTASMAVVSAMLFGMAPAWSAFTSSPVSLLRHAGETKSRRWFGQALIAAQVVLSVVLLSAAGLFVGHLSHLRTVDLGFQRESVLLVSLDVERSAVRQQLLVRYQELLARLQTLPGVRVATLSGMTPLSGAGWSRLVNVEGFDEPPEERRYVAVNGIAPRYFETLGTPLVAGRDFGQTMRAWAWWRQGRVWRSSIGRWRRTTSATRIHWGGMSRSTMTRSGCRTRSSAWSPMRSMPMRTNRRRGRFMSMRFRRQARCRSACCARPSRLGRWRVTCSVSCVMC